MNYRIGMALESELWPTGYAPPCPACSTTITGFADKRARPGRDQVVATTAQPRGCLVDDRAAALQAGASETCPRTRTAHSSPTKRVFPTAARPRFRTLDP